MRYTRTAEYARANIATMQSMLKQAESPVVRFNLEARIEEYEEELRCAERKSSTLAEAEVLFDGEPVKSQIGIDAGFGGAGIRVFEELVATVTADMSGPVGRSGPLPGDTPRLLITDVAHGSFGFQLAEVLDHDPAQGDLVASPLKEALDEVIRLIHAAGDSDEAFDEALAERSQRVLSKLKEFLVTVDEAKATLKVETGRTRFRLDSPKAVSAARNRVDTTTLSESEETVEGALTGLMQTRRGFEIRPSGDDKVITGRIDSAVNATDLVPLYNQHVIATLRRVTAIRGARKMTRWVLLEASAHHE